MLIKCIMNPTQLTSNRSDELHARSLRTEMRSPRRRSIRFLCIALMVINISLAATATATASTMPSVLTAHGNTVDASGNGNAQLRGNERILSRKRRNLIFPKGSSLQLVYDMVYPILDKANLIYIGITGALAYQLPYEPINIDAAFRPPAANDYAANDGDRISTAAAGGNNNQQQQLRPMTGDQRPPPVDRYYTQPKDRYYQTQGGGSGAQGGPASTAGGTYYFGAPGTPPDRYAASASAPLREPGVIDKLSNKIDYYFGQADRLVKTMNDLSRRKIDPWQQVSWSAPSPPYRRSGASADHINAVPLSSAPSSGTFATSPGGAFVPTANRRQHTIHPVFGRKKRSNAAAPHDDDDDDDDDDGDDDDAASLTDMDIIHLNRHRSTRHTLYKRIAKLIDMKNMHGTECVQRALCETSQQRDTGEPDSFLMEIMRAVFSLPLLEDIHGVNRTGAKATAADPAHRLYDDAAAIGRERENCAHLFGRCTGSVWTGAFNM